MTATDYSNAETNRVLMYGTREELIDWLIWNGKDGTYTALADLNIVQLRHLMSLRRIEDYRGI